MSAPIAAPKLGAGLAYCAALLFVAASGTTNAVYGWHRGSDLPSSLVWSGTAVAASIVMALSWPAIIGAVERRLWSRAAMAALALLLTGSFSVAAALGAASGGRTDAASTAEAATSARTRAQTAYDEAKQELAKLGASRTPGEIDADLIAARRTPGKFGCRRIHEILVNCPALEAELGRAHQRTRLQSRMDRAAEALAVGPARQANSDAAALAAFSGFSADTINRLLVVLSVLLLEFGGGLSLAVGMALQVARAPSPTPAPQPLPVVAEPAPPPPRLEASPASARLLEHLRSAGGAISCSQSSLGKSLGVSRTRVAQIIRQLEVRGLLEIAASSTGTKVRLRVQ